MQGDPNWKDPNTQKSADELNIDVRMLQEDKDMDSSWRGQAAYLPDNFEIDERRVNQVVHEARARIDNLTNGVDLVEMVYFDDKMLLEHHTPKRFNNNQGGGRYADMMPQTYSPNGGKDYSYLTEGAEYSSGGWTVVEAVATTKVKKQKIPVWVVRESETDIQYPIPFKEEAVANTLANVLNQYGDVRHPQVKAIVETYKRREGVLKEAKKLSQQVKSGNNSMRPRLNECINQLHQLDAKLGL